MNSSSSSPKKATPREEQPERRIHSAPGAMRNPERVSHKAKPPSSSSPKVKDFISRLDQDYPSLKFKPGTQEHWSPKTNTITFNPEESFDRLKYGLLHELAHALLGHSTYTTDFELLKLESHAWALAAKLGQKYGITIDEDHIQNCLDTYRDWLHRRSTCPVCGTHVLQRDAKNYQCFNCQTVWQVSSGRFVRPYRRTVKA